jgi:hypothetical protein
VNESTDLTISIHPINLIPVPKAAKDRVFVYLYRDGSEAGFPFEFGRGYCMVAGPRLRENRPRDMLSAGKKGKK